MLSATQHARVTESRAKTLFVPVLGVAAALRLAVVALTLKSHPPSWFFGQASELVELAHSLLGGQGLSSPFGEMTGPSAFLAPGYPLLVAAVFRTLGFESAASATAIMVLQATFAVSTIAVMMWLAGKVFDARTANLAGIVWAISPPLIFLPIIFWDTSFSILMLTTLVGLAFKITISPGAKPWFMFTGCGLIALWTNPSLALAFVACFVWAVWFNKRKARCTLAPIAAAILFAVIFSIWPIRNALRLHAFIPLRTNLGYELWQGNRIGSNGFFSPALHPNVNRIEFDRYSVLGEVAYMREKSVAAKAAIESDPGRFFRLTVKRFVYFWLGMGEQSMWLLVAYASGTALLGFAGLFMLFRTERQPAILFLLQLALLPLPYYVTHPDYRFRCVIDPVLTILAAYAVQSWVRRRTGALKQSSS